MNFEFMEYVAKRCNAAVMKSKEIAKMEQEKEDENYIRAKSEEICYMQGFIDAISLLFE